MLQEAFEKLTGFYPTADLYRHIEAAYYEFNREKQEFCEAYKANTDGLAEKIQNSANKEAFKTHSEHAGALATMQRIHEKFRDATGLLANLPGISPEEQDALYAAIRSPWTAIGETVDTIVEVFQQFSKKVIEASGAIVGPLADFLGEYSKHQAELRSVATPRQWHLYLYGKPRVSKKWEHVFEKRLARQKKKGEHTGEDPKV